VATPEIFIGVGAVAQGVGHRSPPVGPRAKPR